MDLNKYIEGLQKLVKEHPEFGKLPVAYAKDDEGNGYQKIINEGPSPCKVEDIEEYHLEMVGYMGGKRGVPKESINCIIIN